MYAASLAAATDAGLRGRAELGYRSRVDEAPRCAKHDLDRWRRRGRQSGDRQTASLAGLAVALLLVVIGLFLVRELHATAVAEDCLLTGRSNCLLVPAQGF